MAKFYLVRHGETEWNKVERFRGQADIPLNETGRIQAEAIGRRLAAEPIVAVFSSPLGRASETAEAIAASKGISVEFAEGLRDMNFGEWEGLTPDEVAAKDRDLYARWLAAPQTVSIPGGESLDDVRARVMSFVDDLTARFNNQGVALVSHRAVCRVLLCAVLGLDNSRIWQIDMAHGALSVFEWDARRRFVTSLINDTCHLH